MPRYRSFIPFWLSQIGMLLLPFLAFGLIYLMTTPQYTYKPLAPGRLARPTALPITFMPPAPRDTNYQFASISPQEFCTVVDQMAEETERALLHSQPTPPPVVATLSERPPIETPLLEPKVIAPGLSGPDGVAVDPRNGNIFVSEMQEGRILLLTRRGRRVVLTDGSTKLYTVDGRYKRRVAPPRSPGLLTMDAAGRLYVAESRPGGRVLMLQLDQDAEVRNTEEVPLPGDWQRYTWRSIAARGSGELLLAGSSVDSEVGLLGGLVQGVILYRDVEGAWWSPSIRPAVQYASVRFSKSGQYAVYADELAGTIGWIDLQSRSLREGASRLACKSPTGVTIMPDGEVMCLEEAGRLLLLDPARDQLRLVAKDLGHVGEMAWDAEGGRLLVAAPDRQALLELIPDASWPTEGDAMSYALCEAEGAMRHVPSAAPEFLAPLLALGGFQDSQGDLKAAFDALTRHMPIVAADAGVVLLHGSGEIRDPVTHVQFVAFDPNRLRFDEPGTDFPFSAIILRTRSGQIFKTTLVRTVVMTGNMWLGKFESHGVFDLPIPFAYQASIGPRGHAVIQFTGLGRSPDIALALNPQHPSESYMILTHFGGAMEEYRVLPAADGSTDNWVVSLPPREAQPWLMISKPPVAGAVSPAPGNI